MSNIAAYHTNILADAIVTATGIQSGSAVEYAYDNRVSYKVVGSGEALIQIDQPSGNIRPWQYVVLCEPTRMNGGEIRVFSYPTAGRSSPTLVTSGTISTATTVVIDNLASAERTTDQYLDIEIERAGDYTWLFGELMLSPKFDSPQLPGVGIRTEYIPRKTFDTLPNGERVAVSHGGVARRKTYTIGGMSITTVSGWQDIFTDGEGTGLVVLDDDRSEIYPCYMSTVLRVDDQAKIFSIQLDFEEIIL